MATDFRGFLRGQAVSNGSEPGAFSRFLLNLCQFVKSVDVFLRNLRNLWFSLAEAERLRSRRRNRPRMTRMATDFRGFLRGQAAKKRR